jgi:hypothetical protein
MTNNHIFLTRAKGDHATCPDCEYWENAFKTASLPDGRRDAAEGKAIHIGFFKAQSRYYVQCCIRSEHDPRWITIGVDYPDSAKYSGIKFRNGSPGNMARTNDNYDMVPCIVSIAGIAVLAFVVPAGVPKNANTMVEICRRTLIWLLHAGKITKETLGIDWRIDSASDNLNRTFLRFASLTSQSFGFPQVSVSCGAVMHTKNDVDRKGACVNAQKNKVDLRTVDDLDYVWRMGIQPSSDGRVHGASGGLAARCDSEMAVTDVFFLCASPDYEAAWKDDFVPEFGGHRTPEVRSVPGEAGFVPGQHCADKVHLFRFKSDADGSVRMHYKTDVRDQMFMPADGDGEVDSMAENPVGLLFLKPGYEKKTFADYAFEWAAQKKVGCAAILRFVQKVFDVVANESSFRGQCVSNVILRDNASFILPEGTGPTIRKSRDDQFTLEQWERSDGKHAPPDFKPGDRMTAYPSSFPRVTMVTWWRNWLKETTVPLQPEPVTSNGKSQSLFKPEVVSLTTVGLALCDPSFLPCADNGRNSDGSAGTPCSDAPSAVGAGSSHSTNYFRRPPAHENPPLTGTNYTKATQKKAQGALRRAQQERQGQCEKCFTRDDVISCDGIRYPRRTNCCADKHRQVDTVISQQDVGTKGIFKGGPEGTLLRSTTRVLGNACIDSELKEGALYTVVGLTPHDAKNVHLPVAATLSLGSFVASHRFQPLSLASYWCVNCVDPCQAQHFNDRDAPLHFTCCHCIESEQAAGFWTPKAVVAEFKASSGKFPTRYLLSFFGMPLPSQNERQQAAFSGTIATQEHVGFYTARSIANSHWHDFLKAWHLACYPFRPWALRSCNYIQVYDVEECSWDRAKVCPGQHRDDSLVDLQFDGDMDDGQPDMEWKQNWARVIWKDDDTPAAKVSKHAAGATASSGGGGGNTAHAARSTPSRAVLDSRSSDSEGDSDDSDDDELWPFD